jgi:hypothetical protein
MEMIAVYCDNHAKHTDNTVWAKYRCLSFKTCITYSHLCFKRLIVLWDALFVFGPQYSCIFGNNAVRNVRNLHVSSEFLPVERSCWIFHC